MGTIVNNSEPNHTEKNNTNSIWDQIEEAQKTALLRFQKDSLAMKCASTGLERIAEDTTLEPVTMRIKNAISDHYFFGFDSSFDSKLEISMHLPDILRQNSSFNGKIGDRLNVYRCLDKRGEIQIKFHRVTFDHFWDLVDLVDQTEQEIHKRYPLSESIAGKNSINKLKEILGTSDPFEVMIEKIRATFPFFG